MLHRVIFCTQCPFSPSIDLSNSYLISWGFYNRKLLHTLWAFNSNISPLTGVFSSLVWRNHFIKGSFTASKLCLRFRFVLLLQPASKSSIKIIFSLFFKIVIKDVLEISSSLASIDTGVSFRHVGSVVEWLKHRTDDQHGLGSKPTCAILLCPWERRFTALSPASWSWQTVLNCNHISTKLLAESNILASPEAGRGNCLPNV